MAWSYKVWGLFIFTRLVYNVIEAANYYISLLHLLSLLYYFAAVFTISITSTSTTSTSSTIFTTSIAAIASTAAITDRDLIQVQLETRYISLN